MVCREMVCAQQYLKPDLFKMLTIKIPLNGFEPAENTLTGPTGSVKFRDILVNKFLSRMSLKVFEINEDKIDKNKCCR